MFGRKFEAAHADWPKTAITKDGGVHVTGKYWTPRGEQGWRTLYLIASGVAAFWAAASGESFGPGIAVFIVLFIAWEIALKHAAFALFAKNLNVRIYHDRIALPSFLGARNYSRAMPIEFRVEQHQGALDREQAKWLHDAIEAVMQYGEKRIVLAEMPQKNMELARALVIRMQNVCDSLDAAIEISARDHSGKLVRVGDFGPAPEIR